MIMSQALPMPLFSVEGRARSLPSPGQIDRMRQASVSVIVEIKILGLVYVFRYGGSGIKKTKHTTGGIPRWSPTVVLVARFSPCVWQSGRDA